MWRHLTSSTTDLSGGSRTLGPGTFRRSPCVPSKNKERCTNLSPHRGSAGGGTPVTITGTNLPHTTKAISGRTLATGITQVFPAQVTAAFPSGTARPGAPSPPHNPAQLLPDQERTTRMRHGETHAQLIAVPPGRILGEE
ncbi:IPT/TIG domain-containing protein [Streptomyces sp. NPDC014734]|uniref:IPT/TIG domain-containing protein n=1 Tax=Streptomyces sp. NPDC014734 TaxID=3364886 RepID=UPI0036F7CC00